MTYDPHGYKSRLERILALTLSLLIGPASALAFPFIEGEWVLDGETQVQILRAEDTVVAYRLSDRQEVMRGTLSFNRDAGWRIDGGILASMTNSELAEQCRDYETIWLPASWYVNPNITGMTGEKQPLRVEFDSRTLACTSYHLPRQTSTFDRYLPTQVSCVPENLYGPWLKRVEPWIHAAIQRRYRPFEDAIPVAVGAWRILLHPREFYLPESVEITPIGVPYFVNDLGDIITHTSALLQEAELFSEAEWAIVAMEVGPNWVSPVVGLEYNFAENTRTEAHLYYRHRDEKAWNRFNGRHFSGAVNSNLIENDIAVDVILTTAGGVRLVWSASRSAFIAVGSRIVSPAASAGVPHMVAAVSRAGAREVIERATREAGEAAGRNAVPDAATERLIRLATQDVAEEVATQFACRTVSRELTEELVEHGIIAADEAWRIAETARDLADDIFLAGGKPKSAQTVAVAAFDTGEDIVFVSGPNLLTGWGRSGGQSAAARRAGTQPVSVEFIDAWRERLAADVRSSFVRNPREWSQSEQIAAKLREFHAEDVVLEFGSAQGWRPIAIAASKDFCAGACQRLLPYFGFRIDARTGIFVGRSLAPSPETLFYR